MSESIPEPPEIGTTERLQESAGQAWEAAYRALYAFVLVLIILIGRAFQAIFVLAQPALLMATIVAAGYTSITLFSTVLVRYGSDIPAGFLALSSVIIVPASLLVLAGDYGIWAVMLAVAVIEFLARLGIERAPPVILALIPILALAGTIFYFLVHTEDVPETVTDDKKGADDE